MSQRHGGEADPPLATHRGGESEDEALPVNFAERSEAGLDP
jgi:hypothetical protein